MSELRSRIQTLMGPLWERATIGRGSSRYSLVWPLTLFFLAACSTSVPTPEARRERAEASALAEGWEDVRIEAGEFLLQSFVSANQDPSRPLTVYIEGDGFAWATPTRASLDPTPITPLALQLALQHEGGNVAYLGRPCQYIGAQEMGCAQRYWTTARFAPQVVQSEAFALDQLKRLTGARDLVLVGYSGGGAIAALLAADRDDVSELITVAGNLGHKAWTSYQRIDPLAGSLDASDVAVKLANVRQTHFVGAGDTVMPPELARRLPVEIRGAENSNLRIIPNFDHRCCWAENWPRLLSSRMNY